MKIVHITDPHLVAPGKPLWGGDAADRFSRCLDDIARWHADAEFCVVSGDLTDAGEPEAYDWLRDRLARFPLRTFLMLGNHDHRERFRAAFPEVPCDPNGFVQQAHEAGGQLFLFLDTYNGGKSSAGEYCAARRDWLAREIDRAGARPVCIFMHHPPCDVGIPRLDRIKLDEADAFAEVLEAARKNGVGSIRHIFFGHVHRGAYVNWRGIPCTALPGTNHQVPLVGESVDSPFSREPAAYAVVLLDDGQTTVHFDACLDRFPAPAG